MTITFRTFVDGLEALTITGVNRTSTQGPPAGAPDVADCPYRYVRLPRSSEIGIVFGEQGGWPTKQAELVICIEPVAQNIQPENFDDTVDMMDNVASALRGAGCSIGGHLEWEIRQTIDTIAGQGYWAVVALVRGTG